jgi:hypothetical protein
MRWYRKAAEGGNVVAQCRLANGYLFGIGVPANPAEAAAWFQKAAALGVIFAQYELGSMYESGEGVPQDYGEAYFWISLAARNETRPAKRDQMVEQRDSAGSHLPEATLEQTRARVLQWSAEHSLGHE